MYQKVDWASRWIGGFCAVAAVGGLPVRGADYAAHPSLGESLLLHPVTLRLDADLDSARQAWSHALSGAPVALVRSVAEARALLLAAAGVEQGEPVGLPANADRDLTESVKRYGALPRFYELSGGLTPTAAEIDARFAWAQPCGGVGEAAGASWVDHSDTLPLLGAQGALPAAALFGLHLSADPRSDGALLVFGDERLARAVEERLTAHGQPDPTRALLQLRRLQGDGDDGLAARQRAALAETRRGLADAAGLELLGDAALALPHHLAVRIPDEADAAIFQAYVKAEQTPVRWLPEVRPLHYAAVREGQRGHPTARELARWMLVPVGPGYSDEEIKHAVLGVVKAAEYLGVRWRTDPARAAAYAADLDELYGPGHDAYRPVFATPKP